MQSVFYTVSDSSHQPPPTGQKYLAKAVIVRNLSRFIGIGDVKISCLFEENNIDHVIVVIHSVSSIFSGMFKIRLCGYLSFLFFLIDPSQLCAQKGAYAVRLAGIEIGEITTSLIESEHTQTYEIISDVSFKILWKRYNRKTINLVTYENEAMKTSFSGVYINNDLRDSAAMNLAQNNYHCYRYPDERFVLNDTQVVFTTVMLYYQEPVGIEKVYSERFLEYCSLEALDDHRYKLYLPNGKVNYYTYAERELLEIFVDRTWFNLRFQRK